MFGQIKAAIKNIPPIRRYISSRTWNRVRFSLLLALSKRRQYTHTRFLRLPRQYDALCGSVLDYLSADEINRPIQIIVAACSIGAEPYSIASTLCLRRPEIDFKVRAFDILTENVERARAASYTEEEVNRGNRPLDGFVSSTFDLIGDTYVVKPTIRDHVLFQVADIFDPRLREKFAPADIVFVQNVLYHFRPNAARRALRNVMSLLADRAAIFMDGVDLNFRTSLTRNYRLRPLEHLLEEIHSDAAAERGPNWPWIYWGLEPIDLTRPDWKTRYATIFLK